MTNDELYRLFGFSVWQERAPQGPWYVQTPSDHIFFGGDEVSARQCLDEFRELCKQIRDFEQSRDQTSLPIG